MNTKKSWKKSSVKLTAVGILSALLFSNCVPAYNSRGEVIHAVDPAAAVIGAVAIGAIAYAVGDNNNRGYRNYYKQPVRNYRGQSHYNNRRSHSRY